MPYFYGKTGESSGTRLYLVNIKDMIYFTSDTHYSHKNLVRGTSRWDDKSRCRDFDTLEQHDNVIVNSINKIVGAEDTLYHLGDWSFGGYENIRRFRHRINCLTVHLILGNHDQNIENNIEAFFGDFASISYYKEIEINGNKIVLSHWPMKIWNKSHRGSWQLHGHCHNHLKPDEWWTKSKPNERRRTMDVGMDTNNYKPWSYSELEKIMDNLTRHPNGLDNHHPLRPEED
jgi:calcineurin-like phosphoesterase family protein